MLRIRVPYLLLLAGVPAFASNSISGANGITVSLDSSGAFTISTQVANWKFSGALGAPAQNIVLSSTAAYQQLEFDYSVDTPRHGFIRAYADRPAILFNVLYGGQAANATAFPAFSTYPKTTYRFSFAGMFGAPSFGGLASDSPLAFFDQSGNTFIVSAASDFMTASSSIDASNSLVTGIDARVAALPSGFAHQSLLVVQSGINQAFDTWGRTLTDLSGKTRPSNDADTVLNTLGYWTDNGATYYYARASGKSYPETLAAVKTGFDDVGLPIGYMQLDSWFYPKGATADWQDRSGGIYTYNGAPAIFEPTVAALDRNLSIPLMTHARWIDADSPYRQMFKISGNVATDPLYWDALGQFMQSSGVATYEQDWLSDQAHTDFNLTDPEAFMNNMAAAMAKYGITMQYCMAQPRHFLAGSKFSNLSSIRTSEDRFDRPRWTNFLFGSRLASSVGIWPFSDVFMSTESDNLLVATLSAGPLGIGDALGAVNTTNLLKAVRADGIIVKPDVPLLPLDASFLSKSAGTDIPIVSATYSDFGGGLRQNYVFAYNEGNNTVANFALADLGITGQSYVYNYFTGAGAIHGASDTISENLAKGRSYYVISPIGGTGIAILGDLDHFVPLGKKRVSQLIDDGWAIHMTVQFAPGEPQRVIQGYAPAAPAVLALAGGAQITYDPATQLFKMTVQPSSTQVARVQIAIVH